MKKLVYVGVRRAQIAVGRLAEEPDNLLELRRALDEVSPGGATCRTSDAAVLDRVSSLLEAGYLRLQEGPRVPFEGLGDPGMPAEEAPAVKETKKKVELTWIEIRLIGEDDQPIPGERYRIELPDGSVREGTLNDKGLARLDGIEAGQCDVTFPALDQEAWVKV